MVNNWNNNCKLVGGDWNMWIICSIHIENNNHPNWRSPSFFRGVGWNHQPDKLVQDFIHNIFKQSHGFLLRTPQIPETKFRLLQQPRPFPPSTTQNADPAAETTEAEGELQVSWVRGGLGTWRQWKGNCGISIYSIYSHFIVCIIWNIPFTSHYLKWTPLCIAVGVSTTNPS